MKADNLKMLLIVPPSRYDFYSYLGQVPNVDFYILFYVDEKDAASVPLPPFIKGQYFWSDYHTPKELLKKINPAKLIFFEIIDQRQISLIVTSNHLKYTTFYLEHGAAGDRETARLRSESGKLKHVLRSRIPSFVRRLTTTLKDVLLAKRFYFYSVSFLNGEAKKKYIKLPLLTLIFNPNKALMISKFKERIPGKSILFNRVNYEEFQLYTGVKEEQVTMDGVPFFDDFYTSQNDNSGPIIYLEHPLLEEGICGWTAEHHRKMAFSLSRFAETKKDKLIVKLHPRSSFALWESYQLESEYFQIIQQGNNFRDLYLNSKLILSYASSMVNGFLCAKKNVVLLGWHPQPHIFGADFSKTGLCHLSFNVEEINQKLQYWITHNLAENNIEKYDQFIKAFNYPFDGKATERIIRTLLTYEVS